MMLVIRSLPRRRGDMLASRLKRWLWMRFAQSFQMGTRLSDASVLQPPLLEPPSHLSDLSIQRNVV